MIASLNLKPVFVARKLIIKMASIAEFYSDRTIFITGVTGFMGKVLLEKLLRSCPCVSKVYVLIRPKKGQDVKTRLTQLLESKV